MIPKILLQTSKDPIPQYVRDMWASRIDDTWEYHWFDDDMAIEYFKNNPLPEFPNIAQVYHSFHKGAHKADLFRYYFLYLNGGIFIDSDAITHVPLSHFIHADIDYFFVECDLELNDTRGNSPVMFNGLMGCIPRSKLLYELLKDAYITTPKALDRYYLYFTHRMYNIINELKPHRAVTYADNNVNIEETIMYMRDNDGTLICTHYHTTKEIPPTL